MDEQTKRKVVRRAGFTAAGLVAIAAGLGAAIALFVFGVVDNP